MQHIGSIIEKVIRKEGHSLTDLSKAVGVNRRTLYNWFQQPRLSDEIVIRIGQTIKHDFSPEFPEKFVPGDFYVACDLSFRKQELNKWKEKYIDLLERYNLLLTLQQSIGFSHNTCCEISFINKANQTYKINLKDAPSTLFLEKCRNAGYQISSVHRA